MMSGAIKVQQATHLGFTLKRTDYCQSRFLIERKTYTIAKEMLPFSHMSQRYICENCRAWENRTYKHDKEN